MTEDPFAVPAAALEAPAGLRVAPSALRTADPATRFVARFLDNLALMATFVPSLVAGGLLGSPDPEVDPGPWLAALAPSAVTTSAFVGWQWYRMSLDGTTIGKRLADVRVVTLHGGPPGFVSGVLFRSGLMASFQALGGLGAPLAIVDALMVFSENGRTLHDRIAGTRVVRGAVPRADEGAVPIDPDDDLDPDL
jgi:uncharacterized RDD family membrane protein YckC